MASQIVPVSDLGRRASELIRAVQGGDQVVYVTRYGRPAVVLVDYEEYEALMAQLDDLSDLASLQAAVDEPDRPYDEFLAEPCSPDTAAPAAEMRATARAASCAAPRPSSQPPVKSLA